MEGIFAISQGVRKVINWKKALEGTCKYENVSDNGANLDVEQLELEEWMHISKPVGSTDSEWPKTTIQSII